ncbi:hypothetical protein KJJ67_004628 [Salmonella enterica]|nr:hypothetical protein [Salmonella enterica]
MKFIPAKYDYIFGSKWNQVLTDCTLSKRQGAVNKKRKSKLRDTAAELKEFRLDGYAVSRTAAPGTPSREVKGRRLSPGPDDINASAH